MRKVEFLDNGNIKVTIPLRLHCSEGRTQILAGDEEPEVSAIAMQIARAFRWQAFIDSGRFANASELADAAGRDAGLIARILRLTRLSPRIIHAALVGELPAKVNYEMLCGALPDIWAEQESILGFPPQQ